MSALQREDLEGLPAPSAELTIVAALVHAHLKTISPRKRRRFLDLVEETVRQHEALANVVSIRKPAQDAEKAKAGREASAWLRMARGAFRSIEIEEDHW